jgi:hypothetical protein
MYAPASESGQRLLAHEVAHVVQQASGREPAIAAMSSRAAKIGAPEDLLEDEAQRSAEQFMNGSLSDEEQRKKRESGSAVQRFIQRQPAPAPDPERAAFESRAETAMRRIVIEGLNASTGSGATVESFAERLKADIQSSFAGEPLALDALPAVLSNADQVQGVSAAIANQPFDYVSALQLLVHWLGLPPEVGTSQPSYGTQAYVRAIAGDVSGYLLVPLYVQAPWYVAQDTKTLSIWFQVLLDRLSDPKYLLGLELDGTVFHLVELRAEFAQAKDDGEAAAIGAELGETARRAVLLNSAVNTMNGLDPQDPTPLEDRLSPVRPQVDQIRAAAATESTTLHQLGNAPQLLKPVPIDFPIQTGGDPTVVTPEEAFPQASDRATLQFLDDLSGRVQSLSGLTQSLRTNVVPASPTYDLDEFSQVYKRWFAFFSPAARDLDVNYQRMRDLHRGIYDALGMAGAEGGIARAVWMHNLVPYIESALGEASPSFEEDVSETGLSRSQRVSGTAIDPQYEFGEIFAAGPAQPGSSGEQASREDTLARRVATSAEPLQRAARLQRLGVPPNQAVQNLVPAPDKAVVIFHDQQAQDTWTYLVRTWTMLPSMEEVNVYEQKEMPREVAAYLLAQQQLRATLATSHRPGVGDTATVAGGVEEGQATATARYLQGQRDTAQNPRAEAAKAQISAAAAQHNIQRDKGTGLPSPAGSLIQDFEKYLNQYFAVQIDPAPRIAAILVIGQAEHNIAVQFMHYFSGDELRKAIAMVLVMAGAKAGLARFGPLGQAVSMGLDKVMELMGVTPGAAMVALAAWLYEASSVSDFHAARAYAFLSHEIADDLGQLAQQYAIHGLVSTINVAAMRGKDPSNVGELTSRFVEPVVQDPRARQEFLNHLDSEIQSRTEQSGKEGYSDPVIDQLKAMAAALRGQSVAEVRDATDIDIAPTEPVEGATRGRDVYRLASPLDRKVVLGKVDELTYSRFLHDAGFANRGATNSGSYVLTVNNTTVRVTVRTEAGTHAMWRESGASPHGGMEGGPARMTLQRDARGEWTASITVNDRALKKDIGIQVSHELDEISDIVARDPAATSSAIEAQTQASMFMPGSSSGIVTAHDRAAARELAAFSNELQYHESKDNPKRLDILDQQARIDRMLIAMGLNQGFVPDDPRIPELRQAGVPDSIIQDIADRGIDRRRAENYSRVVTAKEVEGSLPNMPAITAESAPGHPKSKHGVSDSDLLNVLNNPTHVFTGVNENGREVDVYWKETAPGSGVGSVLFTDAGLKERVITAYGPIATKGSRTPKSLSDFQGVPQWRMIK